MPVVTSPSLHLPAGGASGSVASSFRTPVATKLASATPAAQRGWRAPVGSSPDAAATPSGASALVRVCVREGGGTGGSAHDLRRSATGAPLAAHP